MPTQPDLIARGLGATNAELGIVSVTRYRVYIRNSDYERVGELTDWKALTVIPAFNDVGTWSLVTSSDSVEAALLTKLSANANLSNLVGTRFHEDFAPAKTTVPFVRFAFVEVAKATTSTTTSRNFPSYARE